MRSCNYSHEIPIFLVNNTTQPNYLKARRYFLSEYMCTIKLLSLHPISAGLTMETPSYISGNKIPEKAKKKKKSQPRKEA